MTIKPLQKNTIMKKYHVKGMHCSACENIVYNLVADFDGVKSANVSRKDNTLEIESSGKTILNVYDLNKRLKDFGYSISENNQRESFSMEAYMLAFVIGAILTVTYVILQGLGYLDFSMPQITNEFTDLKAVALSFLTLGVIASITSCAALVGGIITALSRNWSSKNQKISILKFHLGRILSFGVFGVLLGYLGGIFQVSMFFMSILTIIISVLMIIVGLQILKVPFFSSFSISNFSFLLPKLFKKNEINNNFAPLYFGGLTFFIPCGFTLIAQSMAVLSGSPLFSGAIMLSFVIGTLPALLILSFTGYLLGKKSELSDAFSILASVAIILFSLYTVNSQLNVLGLPSINDLLTKNSQPIFGSNSLGVKTVETNKGEIQEVIVLAKEFEYFPQELNLKAGIETNFKVISEKVEGCARAMWLGGLYDKPIYLSEAGIQEVSFIPKKGNYKISCTMGMVSPISVTVQ